MAALGDMENVVLSTISQPGFSFGSYPNWPSIQNPQYSQGEIDFYLNEGYRRACSDLYDLRLATATFALTSISGVGSYPIPPVQQQNPFPRVRHVFDVTYLPAGLTASIRFEPGSGFVSWEQFQRMTGQGYLRANSATQYPRICAVGPTRNTLEIYPSPLATGDAITVVYAALPVPNANQVPELLAQADVPVLPDDAHQAIVYWALSLLFPKQSDYESARVYRDLYAQEIARVREMYQRPGSGDALVMENEPTFPIFNGLI